MPVSHVRIMYRVFVKNALEKNPNAKTVDLIKDAQTEGYTGSSSAFRRLVRSLRTVRIFNCQRCDVSFNQEIKRGRANIFCSAECRVLFYNEKQAARPARGLCRWCPNAPTPGHKMCEDCRVLKNTKGKVWAANTRLEVVTHYGGKCACPGCLESRIEFLALDHINGGGNKHRRDEKIGRMDMWLKRNGFPSGFRVLCHNCNMARGFYGYCPHEKENEHAATQP